MTDSAFKDLLREIKHAQTTVTLAVGTRSRKRGRDKSALCSERGRTNSSWLFSLSLNASMPFCHRRLVTSLDADI